MQPIFLHFDFVTRIQQQQVNTNNHVMSSIRDILLETCTRVPRMICVPDLAIFQVPAGGGMALARGGGLPPGEVCPKINFGAPLALQKVSLIKDSSGRTRTRP